MHGLWGMGQMMFSKYIVVLDADCDVHNTSEVLFRLCANTDPQRDTTSSRILVIASTMPPPIRTSVRIWESMLPPNCLRKDIPAAGPKWCGWMRKCGPKSTRFFQKVKADRIKQNLGLPIPPPTRSRQFVETCQKAEGRLSCIGSATATGRGRASLDCRRHRSNVRVR